MNILQQVRRNDDDIDFFLDFCIYVTWSDSKTQPDLLEATVKQETVI